MQFSACTNENQPSSLDGNLKLYLFLEYKTSCFRENLGIWDLGKHRRPTRWSEIIFTNIQEGFWCPDSVSVCCRCFIVSKQKEKWTFAHTHTDLPYFEKLLFSGSAYTPRHKHVQVSSRCTWTEEQLHIEIEEAGVLIFKHMGIFPRPTHSTVAFSGEGTAAEAKIKWMFSSVVSEFLSVETVCCTARAVCWMKPLSSSAKHNLLETLPCVFHYSYWYDNYLVINT